MKPGQARMGSEDFYTVKQTVLDYLPLALSNYIALPPAFRASKALRDGKTARQMLGEQLDLLDEQLQLVLENLTTADSQALITNGQFVNAPATKRRMAL